MATFVLVHGAWQTTATWDLVVPLLRSAGHAVFVPTLTGIDPGTVSLTPEIDLGTHIADVVRYLEEHDLRDVFLVGHSYAGMIITGVAESTASRLAQLVYVDAFVPENGQAAIQFLPPALRERLRIEATLDPECFRLRGSERRLDLWGLRPGEAREFVRARLHDFSLKCFEQSLEVPAGRAKTLPRAYFACVAANYPGRPIFEPFYTWAKSEGWPTREFATGHDCHVECPEAVASALISLTEDRGEQRQP